MEGVFYSSSQPALNPAASPDRDSVVLQGIAFIIKSVVGVQRDIFIPFF
jgi:hypothetical protein